MTRKGKPVATCGTFNVDGTERKDVRFTVAYDFDKYDGLMLAAYWVSDHKDHPLLRAIRSSEGHSAPLGRDAAGVDERGVRHWHLLGEEVLAGLGVAANLALRGLGRS